VLQALLDDITSEFVIAQLDNFALDAFHNSVFILFIFTLLEDVLNDIVSKLVLGEILNVS